MKLPEVELDAEQVCGTVRHPTTQLCLASMQEHFSPTPPSGLLDVGCGSGILSLVAAKLGVAEILAIDVDPGSVRVTARAAKANAVSGQVRAADTDVADVSGTYPWVIANIDASSLINLADDLLARVAPGGHLLLCGITTAGENLVQSAYRDAAERSQRPSFAVVQRQTQGSWMSLLLSETAR